MGVSSTTLALITIIGFMTALVGGVATFNLGMGHAAFCPPPPDEEACRNEVKPYEVAGIAAYAGGTVFIGGLIALGVNKIVSKRKSVAN